MVLSHLESVGLVHIEVDCCILRPFSLKCFSANLTTVMVLITGMAEPCGQNVSGKFSPVANLRARRRWMAMLRDPVATAL